MTNKLPADGAPPEKLKDLRATAAGQLSPEAATEDSAKGEKTAAKVLTPEEQMALYEKDLKENDWGHQPC